MTPPVETRTTCKICGDPLTPADLSCRACQQMVYSDTLRQIADRARGAETASDFAGALLEWRSALPMLPEDSVQRRSIENKISELAARADISGADSKSRWKKAAAGLGPGALALWKFKYLGMLISTQGKLLLLGLTKVSTFVSMFAFLGVYWTLFGWPFALGLVVSIYVHEMGHVIALRNRGIPASAPMFIPGFGAIIMMRGFTIGAIEEARVGLAGPIYGFGAALFALTVYWITGAPIWSAIAHLGAMINIFNLVPVWQLDGARGFRSLTVFQRRVIVGTALVLWMATSQIFLLAVAGGGLYKLLTDTASDTPDNTAWMQFGGLLAALSAILVLAPR